MHPLRFLYCAVAAGGFLPGLVMADEVEAPVEIVLEDFQSGKFTWETRGDLSKVKEEYKIQMEGANQFLHAEPVPGAEGKSIYKDKDINLKKTPYLKWKWRARALPANGNEKTGPNDSAASVYVMLQKGPFKRRLLKYCWSSTYTGKEWISAKSTNVFWQVKMKVLRQGPPLNQWLEEIVDIKKDFKEAYGENAPDNAEGIGVLTDSDQTKSPSAADYDDFSVVSHFNKMSAAPAIGPISAPLSLY